jgi:hypothetical protein
MHSSRSLFRFCLLLIGLAALVFTALGAGVSSAQAARPQAIDTKGYRGLFYGARGPQGADAVFSRFDQQLLLDDDEEIQRHIRFVLESVDGGVAPRQVPVAVIDAAQGDLCEPAEGSDIGIVVRPMTYGFDHLGTPALCLAAVLPDAPPAVSFSGHVVVTRPRVARMEDRFALWLPIQPLGAPARAMSFEIQRVLSDPIEVETSRWSIDFSRKPLPDNRLRESFELERVAALPLAEGVLGVADRVPALVVRPRASWDEVALEHRAWWDATTRLESGVIPLAARVLSQDNAAASIREAVKIALGEIQLDESDARGGTWLLPDRARVTVEAGAGTASSRGALLMALLRAADIRASAVFVSRSGRRVAPGSEVTFLNQVLVLIQDASPLGGSKPLFVDPSRGPEWMGALDESLLGRDAFLLSAEGARWLRLPGDPPRRHWTLNVRENPDGRFDVSLEALLEGAPAARVRTWQSRGALDSELPAHDLAWLGGHWRGLLAIKTADVAGGRLEVQASGSLEREVVLPDGFLAAPLLPQAAAPSPFRSAWPYARDARLFDLSLLESWTFASRRSGGAMPDGVRVTPFWEVDSLGRWSGPLFKRRSRIRFVGRTLARDATIEIERFEAFTGAALGGVRAP